MVKENAGQRLTLAWPGLTGSLAIGESVAVNGCCLTVVASDGEQFEVQAGPETLLRTNLGGKRAGDRVNFERSLRVGDRLGGHFVQGHIDTTAVLRAAVGRRVGIPGVHSRPSLYGAIGPQGIDRR